MAPYQYDLHVGFLGYSTKIHCESLIVYTHVKESHSTYNCHYSLFHDVCM